jgi:hypothetical protein
VLEATFYLKRHTGYFLIQIYFPCILLVVVSWVAFWINREATADRVTLGKHLSPCWPPHSILPELPSTPDSMSVHICLPGCDVIRVQMSTPERLSFFAVLFTVELRNLSLYSSATHPFLALPWPNSVCIYNSSLHNCTGWYFPHGHLRFENLSFALFVIWQLLFVFVVLLGYILSMQCADELIDPGTILKILA